MLERHQIDVILRVNGLDTKSSDDEIKRVLEEARFKEADIEQAIQIIRNLPPTTTTTELGLHRVFRSDATLKTSEVVRLLGVDADLESHIPAGAEVRGLSRWFYVLLFIISVIVAVSGLLLYMYIHDIGMFHHTVKISFTWTGE